MVLAESSNAMFFSIAAAYLSDWAWQPRPIRRARAIIVFCMLMLFIGEASYLQVIVDGVLRPVHSPAEEAAYEIEPFRRRRDRLSVQPAVRKIIPVHRVIAQYVTDAGEQDDECPGFGIGKTGDIFCAEVKTVIVPGFPALCQVVLV